MPHVTCFAVGQGRRQCLPYSRTLFLQVSTVKRTHTHTHTELHSYTLLLCLCENYHAQRTHRTRGVKRVKQLWWQQKTPPTATAAAPAAAAARKWNVKVATGMQQRRSYPNQAKPSPSQGASQAKKPTWP